LGAAIASARAQTLRDIEILVVSDGASEPTLAVANEHAAVDARVRILDLPKGEGRGERNRHVGVMAAKAPNIVYLADDDLILPRHVELLVDALASHDLVQSRNAHIAADGHLHVWAADLGDPKWHEYHLTDPPRNRTSLTGTAHTAEAYRRLESGWVVPEPGMWADLTLWRQFFRLPGLRAATLPDVTTLQFPANITPRDPEAAAGHRAPWVALLANEDAHERLQEIAVVATHRQLMGLELRKTRLAGRSRTPEIARKALREETREAKARAKQLDSKVARLQRELDSTRGSLSWRVTAPLRAARRSISRGASGSR